LELFFDKKISSKSFFDLLVANSVDKKQSRTLFLRISVNQYHYLKFILEGYDGLAVLSKKENDIVLLRYPAELHEDLIQLLFEIKERICQLENLEYRSYKFINTL
jgi:hypothetical protein